MMSFSRISFFVIALGHLSSLSCGPVRSRELNPSQADSKVQSADHPKQNLYHTSNSDGYINIARCAQKTPIQDVVGKVVGTALQGVENLITQNVKGIFHNISIDINPGQRLVRVSLPGNRQLFGELNKGESSFEGVMSHSRKRNNTLANMHLSIRSGKYVGEDFKFNPWSSDDLKGFKNYDDRRLKGLYEGVYPDSIDVFVESHYRDGTGGYENILNISLVDYLEWDFHLLGSIRNQVCEYNEEGWKKIGIDMLEPKFFTNIFMF